MSDVPEGYKMSEVGVIPEDWEVKTLGEKTTKIGSGITPTGGEKVYKREGRPFLRSQNVGWGNLILEDIAFIDDEIHNTFKATEIEKNDVFLNITGASIGRSAIADERVQNGNVNQHVCIIRTIEDELNPKFLNHFLLSKKGQKQIDSFQAGGNRQGLNFGQIKSFQIPLPPLPEQQAIASALSDVDALITALEQLIIKKRNIKQGTVQQLITGKKRLPGFGGEWEVQKVSDFTLDKKGSIKIGPFGSQLKRETLVNQGYKVYGQENVYENNVELGDRFISTVHFNKLKSCELHPRDFVISMMGTIGKCMIMPNNIQNGIMDSHLLRLQLKNDNVDPIYLSQLFISSIIFNQIKQLSVGGIMDGLSSSIIQQINFPLPSLPEQQAIAQILSDMDTEIEALEQKRGKYKAIKQGMMQELLTGKRRLA